MRSRVELFEQIRRDRDREGVSIHELARRHGVHRRAVRQALESPLPPERKLPEGRPAPKLGPYRALIDSWLGADREAPRKQRHTARRVWERLRDEHGVEVSERQVRRYVRERRRELGDVVDEVFVPLCQEPAAEAEVDWGEATVVLAGARREVHLLLMRACFSGGCFVQAFTRETQQAFLEAHVEAFEFFGGVFELCPLRQPALGGRQAAQGPPARRGRSLRCAALALPVRVELHARGQAGRAREGRRRGRGGPLPPRAPGARARGGLAA
jgi:transposase